MNLCLISLVSILLLHVNLWLTTCYLYLFICSTIMVFSHLIYIYSFLPSIFYFPLINNLSKFILGLISFPCECFFWVFPIWRNLDRFSPYLLIFNHFFLVYKQIFDPNFLYDLHLDMRIHYNPIYFWRKLFNKTQGLKCTTLYPVMITAYINSHSYWCSTFDLYELVHLQRPQCEKYCLDTYIESVWPTISIVKIQFLDICHFISLSVKSYDLLTQLFHIFS
jgi:hypothetical protein